MSFCRRRRLTPAVFAAGSANSLNMDSRPTPSQGQALHGDDSGSTVRAKVQVGFNALRPGRHAPRVRKSERSPDRHPIRAGYDPKRGDAVFQGSRRMGFKISRDFKAEKLKCLFAVTCVVKSAENGPDSNASKLTPVKILFSAAYSRSRADFRNCLFPMTQLSRRLAAALKPLRSPRKGARGLCKGTLPSRVAQTSGTPAAEARSWRDARATEVLCLTTNPQARRRLARTKLKTFRKQKGCILRISSDQQIGVTGNLGNRAGVGGPFGAVRQMESIIGRWAGMESGGDWGGSRSCHVRSGWCFCWSARASRRPPASIWLRLTNAFGRAVDRVSGRMRVGVASPYSINRKALCALLGSIPQVKVVLEMADPSETFQALQKADPGVLLFDSPHPQTDFETIARTRKLLPGMKILVLAANLDEELEFRAIKVGVRGCVSKGVDPELLAKALATVDRGEIWVSQRIASRIIGEFVRSREKENRRASPAQLSRREWEILALVAQGLRNKQIAQHLFVCESTIKTHLYAIYKKLEIGGRIEAVLYYYHRLKENPTSASSIGSLSELAKAEPPIQPANQVTLGAS